MENVKMRYGKSGRTDIPVCPWLANMNEQGDVKDRQAGMPIPL
jgi:hypothetical protein